MLSSIWCFPVFAWTGLLAHMKKNSFPGTGRIDFHGLLTILALKLKHPDTEEHLRLAFKIFDKDGNGNVSAAELKDAMATLGGDVTQDDIDQMITLADTDGDGQVNYEGQY